MLLSADIKTDFSPELHSWFIMQVLQFNSKVDFCQQKQPGHRPAAMVSVLFLEMSSHYSTLLYRDPVKVLPGNHVQIIIAHWRSSAEMRIVT